MKIRKIEVDRFRGIQKLDWDVRDYFICLVGPCESTKSTILDAIDLALSTRWNVQFDDTDLHHGNTDQPTIKITIGEIPDEIKSDEKYGLFAQDLPSEGVIDIISLSINQCGEQAVRDTIAVRMEISSNSLKCPALEWVGLGIDETSRAKSLTIISRSRLIQRQPQMMAARVGQ